MKVGRKQPFVSPGHTELMSNSNQQPKSRPGLRSVLRRRLLRMLSKPDQPRPVRQQRLAISMVRPLEPRFVLNATAELNLAGQLLVTGVNPPGTIVDETVVLDVNSNGDLQLFDEAGEIIPIANHSPDPTSPIDPSDISSGQIIFDLGDGDDVLDLQLPAGLDVIVSPGNGNDRTFLQFDGDGTANSVQIDSDQIFFDASSPLTSINGSEVVLTGDVFVDSNTARSQVDLGSGSLRVEGRFVLAQDTVFVGAGADLDLENATVSARTTGIDLAVEFDDQLGGDVRLGGADSASGALLEDLAIVSATDVSVGTSPVEIGGDLTIQGGDGLTAIGQEVNASSVIVVTEGNIDLQASLQANGGQVLLSTSEEILVAGDIETIRQTTSGAVNLVGQSVTLADATIRTAGGLVNVSGSAIVQGTVFIDSGNSRLADSAGRIQFFDEIESENATDDTLTIDARGASLDGTVRFQGDIGNTQDNSSAQDLNALDVVASRIETESISVVDGDLRLEADTVRLFGNQFRSRGTGDVLVIGELLLPIGDSVITSENNVNLLGPVRGQVETQTLSVDAARDVRFDAAVSSIRNLNVTSGGLAEFRGEVTLAGDIEVDANSIRIAADVDTTAGSIDGRVDLIGTESVFVENDAVISAGLSDISVDGGGGEVIFADSTLQSDSSGDALLIQNATRVVLGNVDAGAGNLVLGVGQNVGSISQGSSTSIIVDRLTISSSAEVDLTNSANDIRSVVDVVAVGDIAISDAVDDIEINAVNSTGNDVQITTGGSIVLAEVAVTALGGSTTLSAGRSIVDRDENTIANILSTTVQLNAGAEGIGSPGNPVDVVATNSLSASTSQSNGDISIANVGSSVSVGVLDAGSGRLLLIADSIDDAAVDSLTDIIADEVTFIAASGIGNDSALELFSVEQLRAENGAGNIELDLTATEETVISELLVDSGNIVIRHRGADGELPIELQSVTTNDGSILIDAGGAITAQDIQSLNRSSTDDASGTGGSESRDVTLIARGVQSDILVNSIAALGGADVILNAEDDILDLDPNDDRLIIADDLRLTAGNGGLDQEIAIGLTTSVDDLIADVGGTARGDVSINQTGSIRLASSDRNDANDDIVTANGEIIIRASGTIDVVANPLNEIAIDAGGEGGILLTAQGEFSDVRVARGLRTDAGDVRLVADRNLEFTAEGDIDSRGGDIELRADAQGDRAGGLITMADGALADAGDGRFLVVADENITLGGLLTSSADDDAVTITSNTAAIIDGGDIHTEIDANAGRVTLSAISGVGDSDALETSIDRLVSSVSNTGSTRLIEFDAITLESVITNDGEIDILAGGTVNAVLVESLSSLNIEQDIRLEAIGEQSDIIVTSIFAANQADVELLADDDVRQELPLGTVTIIADDLNVVAQNSQLDSDSPNGVSLGVDVSDFQGLVDGGNRGDILIQAVDSIRLASSDEMDDEEIRTTNGQIEVLADGTIDVVANPLSEIAIDAGGEGGILLTAQGEFSDVRVARGLRTDAGDVRLVADRNLEFTAEGDIDSRGGDIELRADAQGDRAGGLITMADGALADAGDGRFLVVADENITLGGLLTSSADDDAVTITSNTAAIIDGGDIHTEIDANAGRVTLSAISGVGDSDALETSIDRLVSSVSNTGSTRLIEFDAITLESVITNDGEIDILAGGTVNAVLVESLSSLNIEQDIRLEAIGEQSDIIVTSIFAANQADVELLADDDVRQELPLGTVTIIADDLNVVAQNSQLDSDSPNGVSLGVDVSDFQGLVDGGNRGDILIQAVDSIRLASSDEMDDEEIRTTNGQIVVRAGGTITIVDSQGDSGENLNLDREITAGGEANGRIDLESDVQIELQDQVQLRADQVRPAPVPTTANTEFVPLEVERSDRSVYLEATTVIFGQDIEINSGTAEDGTDVGVARIFAPRPPLVETADPNTDSPEVRMPQPETFAFFDPGSVSTNVLEQALVNDSVGLLTLDIGRQGERGLTVDIDWGAPTRRFQRINGLSADDAVFVGVDSIGNLVQPVDGQGEPVLAVEHFYQESDITESTENGRASGTSPIEVRFAVRHHESIVVFGDTVQQAPEGELVTEVQGGVISSSDDLSDDSPGLDNGTAAFVVPALSIPVAFFPTREVIPEIDTPEFVVRAETGVTVSQATTETVETTTTTTVSRKEYFQIRVLSPDPDGEDLVPPQELPDDILSGDKIQNLFESLPDGQYEIEHVIGDGNERSILRVDVRGGKATIPGEELDEGLLRLKRMSGEPTQQSVEEIHAGEVDPLELESKSFDLPLPSGESESFDEVAPQGEELPVPQPQIGEQVSNSDVSQQARGNKEIAQSAVGVLFASKISRRRSTNKKRLSKASRFTKRGKREAREDSQT